MMRPFTTLTATVVPLLRDNVDTDAIIPSREMRSVTKTGLADGLFAGWRYTGAGSRDPNPDFVLNDPRFTSAQILLTGANFGCGSSREHAVWALAEFGFRVIIAETFNPIFRGNCVNNGIVPVELAHSAIVRIAGSLGDWPADHPVTVDLSTQTIASAGAAPLPFTIDEEARQMLLGGMDAIALTLNHRDAIDRLRAVDRVQRPWIYLKRQAEDSEKERTER